MLGYIVPDKPELKLREFDLYSGYYCGVCRSIGARYGQIPRLALSYDSVFLAMMLSGLNASREDAREFRCPIWFTKKRLLVENNPAVDYGADILLLLVYYKLRDDLYDENSLRARAGLATGKNIFKKLLKRYPQKGIILEKKIKELTQLEKEKCRSMDQAAEPFALLMKDIFVPEDEILCKIIGRKMDDEELQKIRTGLGRTGYHMGKWIYLIDAWDDIEEDIKQGTYNPLLYRFEYDSEEGSDTERESSQAFRDRIRDRVRFNLMCYLEQTAEACGELDFQKNKGIIENIVYLGLLKKTEQMLQKGILEEQNGKSI